MSKEGKEDKRKKLKFIEKEQREAGKWHDEGKKEAKAKKRCPIEKQKRR